MNPCQSYTESLSTCQSCNDRCCNRIFDLNKQLSQKDKVIERMRETLEVYANEGSWTTGEWGPPENVFLTDYKEFGWDKARQCLEETKGELDEGIEQMKNLIILESHEDYGIEWSLSFNGSNPSIEECFPCKSKEDAIKLRSLIERYVSMNIAPNHAV